MTKLDAIMSSVATAIRGTKGEDVIVYDFTSVNPFIDRAVLCSASNLRQVNAIAQNIKDECRKNGLDVRVEGNSNSKWVLVDLDEVIVHIFLDEEREVYKLERLYSDLPRLEQEYDV